MAAGGVPLLGSGLAEGFALSRVAAGVDGLAPECAPMVTWLTTFLLPAYDWTIRLAVSFSRAVATLPLISMLSSATDTRTLSPLKVGSLLNAF